MKNAQIASNSSQAALVIVSALIQGLFTCCVLIGGQTVNTLNLPLSVCAHLYHQVRLARETPGAARLKRLHYRFQRLHCGLLPDWKLSACVLPASRVQGFVPPPVP